MRVLLVIEDEDDFVTIRDLVRAIPNAACDVEWLRNHEQVRKRLTTPPSFDLWLMEYPLGGRDNVVSQETIFKAARFAPLIFLVGEGDADIARQTGLSFANDYLVKERIDLNSLERSLRHALRQGRDSHAANALEVTIRQPLFPPEDGIACLVERAEVLYHPPQSRYRNHELPCDPQELTGVRRFVESFCLDFCQGRMSEQALYQLELAVHEIVSNIIRHAYPAASSGRIQLEATALENEVRIRIVDYGTPFAHPEDVPAPAFDGTREHGFGLFLVNEGVDKQTRFRDELGRNILTLIKLYDRKEASTHS